MFHTILSAQKIFHPKFFFTQIFSNELWVKQGATQLMLPSILVFIVCFFLAGSDQPERPHPADSHDAKTAAANPAAERRAAVDEEVDSVPSGGR